MAAAVVGLLYDSVSPNTGDWAIGIAVSQELARHGITRTQVLDPFGPVDAHERLVVVGGGDLIRPTGDRFYDRFRVSGPAVLNAAGVWPDADRLDFLQDYHLVSARTSAEVDHLRSVVPHAELLPDTTMTLESPHFPIEGLPTDEPVVGIHVVPHTLHQCPELVAAIDAIDHPKVFIPFTHYNSDDSFMQALPFDRSRAIDLPRLTPLQLHSVIGQMSYVVVSSLHATFFAYAQGVPFVTVDQRKVRDFLADRGLTDWLFSDDPSLREAVARAEQEPPDLSDRVERDRSAVRDAFARIASVAEETGEERAPGPAPEVPAPPSPADPTTAREVVVLAAEQRADAVTARDHLIAETLRVATDLRTANAAVHRELFTDRTELERARDHVARLRSEVEGAQNHIRGLQSELHLVRAELEGTAGRRAGRLVRRGLGTARSIVGRWKSAGR